MSIFLRLTADNSSAEAKVSRVDDRSLPGERPPDHREQRSPPRAEIGSFGHEVKKKGSKMRTQIERFWGWLLLCQLISLTNALTSSQCESWGYI
jgi:hypothetical protein